MSDRDLLTKLRVLLSNARDLPEPAVRDAIAEIDAALVQPESVGLVCGSDDKGGFFGQLDPSFKMPDEKFTVYAAAPKLEGGE